MSKKKEISLSSGNWDLTEDNSIKKISNKEYKIKSKNSILDLADKIENWMILLVVALALILSDLLLFAFGIVEEWGSIYNIILLLFSSGLFGLTGILGYYQSSYEENSKAMKVWIIIVIMSIVMFILIVILLIIIN
jgi:hypothetical protein